MYYPDGVRIGDKFYPGEFDGVGLAALYSEIDEQKKRNPPKPKPKPKPCKCAYGHCTCPIELV